MAVNLNINQVTELQNFLQNAQYADGYNYLRDVVEQKKQAEGDPAKSQDLVALSAWFDAAAHINANDGSFVSEYVRGATESVIASQGITVTDQQFQAASNQLAETLLTKIIQDGSIDSAQQVANADIQNGVRELQMPEWGWAGAVTDFIAPPFGLGKDLASIPFDRYDEMVTASREGLMRFIDRQLQLPDGTIHDVDAFLRSLPKDFIQFAFGFVDITAIGKSLNDLYLNARTWTPPPPPPRRDPLTLDLDGDGIETTGVTGAVLFDHNCDGIRTGSGWVGADDGLLVLDRNGNGQIDNGAELFGADTLLANGQKASDGFAALRDLDSNGDNVFDAQDARFADVRVWRDLSQNGVSQNGELFTLETLGITAINLNAANETVDLGNGNLQTASATYVRANGTTGEAAGVALGETAANLELAQNPFYRQFTDTIALTGEAGLLPQMQGSGMVRDLREAASLSPELATAASAYAAQTTRAGQMSLLDGLITAWAGTAGMEAANEGVFAMGRAA